MLSQRMKNDLILAPNEFDMDYFYGSTVSGWLRRGLVRDTGKITIRKIDGRKIEVKIMRLTRHGKQIRQKIIDEKKAYLESDARKNELRSLMSAGPTVVVPITAMLNACDFRYDPGEYDKRSAAVDVIREAIIRAKEDKP